MPLSTTSSEPARVLLVDDNDAMLARAAAALKYCCLVVGSVKDSRQALDAALSLKPDVIVLDISMPGMSGLAVAAHLAESAHPPRIVFLTVHDDPAFVEAARNVGALAYVIKRHICTDLVPAIYRALEGRSQFPSPAVESHEHSAR